MRLNLARTILAECLELLCQVLEARFHENPLSSPHDGILAGNLQTLQGEDRDQPDLLAWYGKVFALASLVYELDLNPSASGLPEEDWRWVDPGNIGGH